MRFGANYTPSRHWWHIWLDFDTPGTTDGIRRKVSDIIHDAVGRLGENIQVRRFARYHLGEGAQKN